MEGALFRVPEGLEPTKKRERKKERDRAGNIAKLKLINVPTPNRSSYDCNESGGQPPINRGRCTQSGKQQCLPRDHSASAPLE